MSYPKLIKYEEGWRDRPYLCSEGYPTVGFGFRIGLKGVLIKNYDFTLPLPAGEAWLKAHTEELLEAFDKNDQLRRAMAACLTADKVDPDDWENSPRLAVLLSMAHQMGLAGLLGFIQTLKFIQMQAWSNVRQNMLKSLWAQQTPQRAARHAEQMYTGEWAPEYGV